LLELLKQILFINIISNIYISSHLDQISSNCKVFSEKISKYFSRSKAILVTYWMLVDWNDTGIDPIHTSVFALTHLPEASKTGFGQVKIMK
jgi:hypothetical protein